MSLLQEIIEVVEHWRQQVEQHRRHEPEQSRKLANKEAAALELGRKVAQLALQHMVEEDGSGQVGTSLACDCGARLGYQRQSERCVRTLVGEIRYHRAYYYCRACGASQCPKDEQLGQGRREISAGVERHVALLGAHLSFECAAHLLAEIGRVTLSGRQVETIAEAIGCEAEEKEVVAIAQTQQQPLPVGEAAGKRARVWVIEMDGVMVGLRGGQWQEVKTGIIYELSQRVEINQGRWELLERQRCEVRGSADEFRERLWALLHRVGVSAQDQIVVVADGAEWIEQTVAWLFPAATRIMDFYHVAERVWAVAGVRYGEGSAQAESWAGEKLRSLKRGEVALMLAALKRLKLAEAEARRVRASAVSYIEKHRAGMGYDEYQAAGLPIGSGAIEGSCKYLVTARCKQAGMRWSEEGVDAILALRCWVLNQRLDELRPKPKITVEWAQAA